MLRISGFGFLEVEGLEASSFACAGCGLGLGFRFEVQRFAESDGSCSRSFKDICMPYETQSPKP